MAQQLVGTVPDGVSVVFFAADGDEELGGFWVQGGDSF